MITDLSKWTSSRWTAKDQKDPYSATPIERLKKIRKIAMEFHDDATDFKHEFLQERLQKAGFETALKWDGRSPYGFMYGRRK